MCCEIDDRWSTSYVQKYILCTKSFSKLCVLGAACARVLLCSRVRFFRIPEYYNVPEVLSCTKSFWQFCVSVTGAYGSTLVVFPHTFILRELWSQRFFYEVIDRASYVSVFFHEVIKGTS